jgi:hypothetical protein
VLCWWFVWLLIEWCGLFLGRLVGVVCVFVVWCFDLLWWLWVCFVFVCVWMGCWLILCVLWCLLVVVWWCWCGFDCGFVCVWRLLVVLCVFGVVCGVLVLVVVGGV